MASITFLSSNFLMAFLTTLGNYPHDTKSVIKQPISLFHVISMYYTDDSNTKQFTQKVVIRKHATDLLPTK
jgi:hypothetical protein